MSTSLRIVFILIIRSGVCCSLYLLLQGKNNVTCYTNSSSGLALILPNLSSDYFTKGAEYKPVLINDEFSCNIDLPSPCNSNWEILPWQAKNSLQDINADYILDRRWEEFETIYTTYNNSNLYFHTRAAEITNEDFTIPLSILTNNNAHIFLCVKAYPHYSDCYWFVLKGWNGDRSVLRKCKSRQISKSVQPPNGTCNNALYTINHNTTNIDFFSDHWEHFKIVKRSNTLQLFGKKFGHKPLMEHTDNGDILKIKYMAVQSRSTKGALWKVHNVQYISTTVKGNIFLGPLFHPDNDFLCISMFVKMCSTCRMKIGFEGASDNQSLKIMPSTGDWKHIKYFIEDNQRDDFQLKIQTTVSNNSNIFDKYWYIDSPRICQRQEYRELQYSESDPTKVKCQLIADQEEVVSVPKRPVPNKVQDLQFYFQNTTSLGIRWKRFNTLTEILETFIIFINETKQFIKGPQNCRLWPEYHCWEITNIDTERNCYNIVVSVQIKNVSQIAESSQLNSKELPKRSSEVYDLSSNWSNERNLTLSWKHPNYTYGDQIKFTIQIRAQNSSNILEEAFERYEAEYNLTYSHIVQSKLLPSNFYEIQIFTLEPLHLKENMGRILSIISPPPIPEMNKNPELKLLNDYLFISFSVKKEIYPLDKAIYIISISKEFPNTPYTIGTAPLVDNTSKILYEGVIQNNDIILEIKNDVNDEHINSHFKGTVKIILVYEYKFQIRSKVFYVSMDEIPDKANLLPLFSLLLLIPIAIIIILKMFLTKLIYCFQRDQTIYPNEESEELAPFTMKSKVVDVKFNEDMEKEDSKLTISAMKTEEYYSKLIKINDFEQYVKESLAKEELERQHALFPRKLEYPATYGELKVNKDKNRYNNIIAYDHSRVILEKINGDEYSDYINANYIDGYKVPQAYIATQAPKPNTLYDFWRMIWQENVQYIVMLANIYENGKKKVEKYWPDMKDPLIIEDITIRYIFNEEFSDYEKREFAITKNGQQRKVKQLHFCTWPDQSVPSYFQSLVPFIKEILKIPLNVNSPIVLHCSAGVGRTGTILLCDICLRMAKEEHAVDVLNNLQKLRQQRSNLVDIVKQYKLAHLVILECLIGLDTRISCSKLRKYVKNLFNSNGIKKQMQYLVDSAWQDRVFLENDAEIDMSMYNEKNRVKTIVPGCNGRIFLSYYPSDNESSSYINAVRVDSFKNPGRYIVTQQPLPNTLGDFWRLIDEQDISVIISLQEINLKDASTCQFWPTKTIFEINPVDYIMVKYLSSKTFDCYNLTTIQMSVLKTNRIRNIDIISMKDWTSEALLPPSTVEFIGFWKNINHFCRRSEKVLVTCYDGVTASGIYIATDFIMGQLNLERNCDICQTVKIIRRNRKEFISTKDQYIFLYEIAAIGCQSCDNINRKSENFLSL